MYYSIIFSLIVWERLTQLSGAHILVTVTGSQLLGASYLLPHLYQYGISVTWGHIWFLHQCRWLDTGPHTCPTSTLPLDHHLAQGVSLEITLSTTLLTVEKDKYWSVGLEILPRCQTKKNREENWSENNRRLHIASLALTLKSCVRHSAFQEDPVMELSRGRQWWWMQTFPSSWQSVKKWVMLSNEQDFLLCCNFAWHTGK